MGITIRDIAIAFGYEVDKKSEEKVEGSIKNLKSMAIQVLGAIGIGFSLVQISAISEEFSQINDQIRNATNGMGDQEEIQKKIVQSANDARMAYGDMAKFATNLTQEDKALFGNLDEALNYAELTAKTFKAAGKSNAEVLQLQEAINKSFAKGAVDSETINQLYEKSPEAINMMARTLGVAKENLGKMATEGKIQLSDLKRAFTENADEINIRYGNVGMRVSDALLNIRNQWGQFVAEQNEAFGTSDAISKIMVRGFTKFLDLIRKGTAGIKWLSDKVGGFGNLIKLLMLTLGAVYTVMKADKIVQFLKTIPKLLKAINLQMMAGIALIILIALLIDDFINFMKGNDSVIGLFFEKMGIDADKVRDTIKLAWGNIKDFLIAAWVYIKDFGIQIFEKLKQFWAKWGDQITNQFKIAFEYIVVMIKALITVMQGIITFISGVFTGDWKKAWEGIRIIFKGVLEAIFAVFKAIWDSIYNWFSDKIDAIIAKVTGFVDAIREKIQSVKDFLGGAADIIGSVFGGGNTVKASTVNTVRGGGNRTSNVNQTVNIKNTFNGGDPKLQQQGAKAMNKSADDATGKMARGLAYARG